jgi:predicted dehydrogenase
MKFLIVGLGSMGKRRIRCLQALGYNDIVGFDLKEERRNETVDKYLINSVDDIAAVKFADVDAVIVSTPPDQHTQYVKFAIDHNKPVFVEASVILEDVKEIKSYNSKNDFVAPSCTLRFHPMIKDITRIIKSEKYGKITNFSYHSGQYLPDWHPWEKVSDFYVSKRETGGGREIVPFELTWIVDTIGWPKEAKGYFAKTINIEADIEDSYAFVLKCKNAIGTIIVDVAARYAVRNLIINLEFAQIQWKWDDAYMNLYEAESGRWIRFNQPEFSATQEYNKNIGEQMYIDEINSFVSSIISERVYPNSIEDDIKVLEILNNIEKSDGGF